MIEYSVILQRHPGSNRPDVCIFRDEDREKALSEMLKYDKANGFTVLDKDGRFTIATIALIEKESIYGSPVISCTPFHKIFDYMGRRL